MTDVKDFKDRKSQKQMLSREPFNDFDGNLHIKRLRIDETGRCTRWGPPLCKIEATVTLTPEQDMIKNIIDGSAQLNKLIDTVIKGDRECKQPAEFKQVRHAARWEAVQVFYRRHLQALEYVGGDAGSKSTFRPGHSLAQCRLDTVDRARSLSTADVFKFLCKDRGDVVYVGIDIAADIALCTGRVFVRGTGIEWLSSAPFASTSKTVVDFIPKDVLKGRSDLVIGIEYTGDSVDQDFAAQMGVKPAKKESVLGPLVF
jgi:hypothetical protein